MKRKKSLQLLDRVYIGDLINWINKWGSEGRDWKVTLKVLARKCDGENKSELAGYQAGSN